MKYEEFKKICLESLKEKAKKEKFSSDFLERFKKELIQAECYYLDGKDLYEELKTKKSLSRYTIPYVLGFNDSYDLSKKMQLIQIKDGDSGGIDIDSDFETSGRDIIIDYLKQKYGEDCVFPVGTVSMLGLKSAAKDLLKYYEASFKESNEFTSALDDEFSFEENIERFKTNNKSLYSFYLKNKNILDLVPKFLNKIRQYSKHAGGVLLLPKPIWNYIPVEMAGGNLVTAYVENGQNTVLDALGLVKLDLLGITVLTNVKETINLIEEDLFLIEEDGIRKVVPKSYLQGKEFTIEKK